MNNDRDDNFPDLSGFDDDFVEAPLEDRDDEIPDGRYQAVVERAELTHARSSGNPMLKWQLRILGPSSVGRVLWRHNVIATRENLRWLKKDLHTCGLHLERLSELQANLNRLLGVVVEVVVRTAGENRNTYLNRRIVAAEGEHGTDHTANRNSGSEGGGGTK